MLTKGQCLRDGEIGSCTHFSHLDVHGVDLPLEQAGFLTELLKFLQDVQKDFDATGDIHHRCLSLHSVKYRPEGNSRLLQ